MSFYFSLPSSDLQTDLVLTESTTMTVKWKNSAPRWANSRDWAYAVVAEGVDPLKTNLEGSSERIDPAVSTRSLIWQDSIRSSLN